MEKSQGPTYNIFRLRYKKTEDKMQIELANLRIFVSITTIFNRKRRKNSDAGFSVEAGRKYRQIDESNK